MNRDAFSLVLCSLPSVCAAVPLQEGQRVNAAEFGIAYRMVSVTAGPIYCPAINDGREGTFIRVPAGGILLVEWRQARDVCGVAIRGAKLPPPERVRIEYWCGRWPDNGTGGWQTVDDPYNGRWTAVRAEASRTKDGLEFTFSPLSAEEKPDIKRAGHSYRQTYKIRAFFEQETVVSELEAYTASAWKRAELKMEWRPSSTGRTAWDGKVDARNARILSVKRTERKVGPVYVKVMYADNPNRLSADRGLVIFRTAGWDGFSIFVDDVLREGELYVRDIDAFVSDASLKISYGGWTGPKGEWDETVIAKVAKLPEQSLTRAMQAIPAKLPREAHLGVPDMRQEFTIQPNGDIALLKESLRSPGTDADRRPWEEDALAYRWATGDRPDFEAPKEVRRFLEKNYLPVMVTEWQAGAVRWRLSAFATMLLGAVGEGEAERKGNEPLALLVQAEVENRENEAQAARLWLGLSRKERWTVSADGLLLPESPSDGRARPGLTPVRGRFDTNGKGTLTCRSEEAGPVLGYETRLAPGEAHKVFLSLTYIELLDEAELNALKSLRYDRRHDEVVAYWEARLREGMRYEAPEPILNDLFKANLWHVLISTDRDPETGLDEHGAATMGYRVFANETGMVARSLEMRGLHREAFRLLEPFLACQGKKPLPGNFKGQEGLLYAAHPDPLSDPYTAQGYNMHHGWALWNLSEHFLWTGDRACLEAMAPRLVAACDWITRERRATKVYNPDGTKPVEWGLAPAGDLEDVEEYLYWYATNAYYYLGMKTAGDALARIGHPEARRLKEDAAAFREDILASLKESIATSPAVKLKDGRYIPYVPPRAYAGTHRKEGWIREGLYPALHLLDAEVLEPESSAVTWMLEELEDNIFMSAESGYLLEDAAEKFFNWGGFNPQPNLLGNSLAHLRRDEIPHFLRVLFNTCAASLFPDTMCFAEWVPRHGEGGGPLYKTPDECKFIQYLRQMLILEDGDSLRLGMGVPRQWMEDGKRICAEKAATYFGPMSLEITSHAAEGYIAATLTLPDRQPPAEILLRLRHPEGKPMRKVKVNGAEWDKFQAERETIVLPKEMREAQVRAEF